MSELFAVGQLPLFVPRFNVAPTQQTLAIRPRAEGGREAVMLNWGLIPAWAKDASSAGGMINARSETAATKPTFRAAMRARRCLIPADGFYEWQKAGKAKQPFLIERPDHGLFAFAGLWERWQSPDGPVESCTILTTVANQRLAPLHDRMPVILDPAVFDPWLDTTNTPDEVERLLRPYPDELLQARPVSGYVNSARHEGPQCVEAADASVDPTPGSKSPNAQRSFLD